MSIDTTPDGRGPIWSTGVVADLDRDTAPQHGGMPVPWTVTGAVEAHTGVRAGDGDVSGPGEAPVQQSAPAEPEPDAVARGWVVPPGASRVDAIFVLSGTSLGIGRVERATSPVWLDLDDLVTLDAIGEPVDGLTEVEIRMDDDRIIGAGWTDEFCDAVVAALQGAPVPANDEGEPVDEPVAGPVADAVDDDRAAADDAVVAPAESAPTVAEGAGDAGVGAAPTTGAVATLTDADAAPGTARSGSALELEDVVYLGGYPGQPKRRKKCVAGMSRSAFEVSGPGDLQFRVGWDVVRTIEVQNADEARFRMNTKVHRDASALVIECDQGVTILLEARDCPTIALRTAISQLLDGLPVVVV